MKALIRGLAGPIKGLIIIIAILSAVGAVLPANIAHGLSTTVGGVFKVGGTIFAVALVIWAINQGEHWANKP